MPYKLLQKVEFFVVIEDRKHFSGISKTLNVQV